MGCKLSRCRYGQGEPDGDCFQCKYWDCDYPDQDDNIFLDDSKQA